MTVVNVFPTSTCREQLSQAVACRQNTTKTGRRAGDAARCHDRIPVFIYNKVKHTRDAGCAPAQRMSYKARDIDDTACVRHRGTEPPQGRGDTGAGLTCLQGSCHPAHVTDVEVESTLCSCFLTKRHLKRLAGLSGRKRMGLRAQGDAQGDSKPDPDAALVGDRFPL